MRVCVNLKIIVLLIGFSAAILVGAGSAKADFIFGTPTNLGPTINSSASDHPGRISVDGLRLYFSSRRPEGIFSEWYDIWVTARPTKDDPWEEPVYLGPAINTANSDFEPDITPDELTLVFTRFGSGGPPNWDVWITTRPTTNDPWGSPMNLGTANSSAGDGGPSISADGLTIFFESNRSGGHGDWDVWMTTRPTIDDPWGESINLDSTINSSRRDGEPSISADGRMLFFSSERPGGTGGSDLYVTTRPTTNDPWGTPINLGQTVNSSANDGQPAISLDGRELYFRSNRPGGQGGHDIWQAPILPVVDFNGDGIVDSADMCIMVDYWGTDEPLCDIGPMPWGDGIVDVQDLIILAEHLFEEFPPVE